MKRSPILQRRCDGCRFDRTRYSSGDLWSPPDVEVGCAILDDPKLESVAGSVALKKYNDSTIDHIFEHGGCPAWQPWELCAEHGMPVPPMAECYLCENDIAIDELDSFREPWQ